MRARLGWFLATFLAFSAAGGPSPPALYHDALVPGGEVFPDVSRLFDQISRRTAIHAVAWSRRDVDIVAWGSADGIVYLRDLRQSIETLQISACTSAVASIAFSSDGSLLATVCRNSSIRIWNIKDALQPQAEEEGDSVAFSPDGRLLAIGRADGSIVIRELGEEGASWTLKMKHKEAVTCLAWSDDSATLASGSSDWTAKTWSIKTGEVEHTFGGHSDRLNAVALSHGSEFLATASSDNNIVISDVKTATTKFTLRGHTSIVNDIAWSSDDRSLISASDDSKIIIWDMYAKEKVAVLEDHTDVVFSLDFSPDGLRIISGSRDATVRVWAFGTGREIQRFEGHIQPISAISFNARGSLLAVASYSNKIFIWHLSGDGNGKVGAWPEAIEVNRRQPLTSVAVSTDGNLVAAGFSDGAAQIWSRSPDGDGRFEAPSALRSFSGSTFSLAFSPDDRYLALGDDSVVSLWDLYQERRVGVFSLGDGAAYRLGGVLSVAFSEDGGMIASGYKGRGINVWNVESRALISSLSNLPEAPSSIGFLSSQSLVAVLRNGGVYRWNINEKSSSEVLTIDPETTSVAIGDAAHALALIVSGGVVRLDDLQVLNRSRHAIQLLATGAHGTWITCDSINNTCFRYDDGSLLVKIRTGKVEPEKPAVTLRMPVLTKLSSSNSKITVSDGEVAPFVLRLRNDGRERVYWLNIRKAADGGDERVIFYPPPTLSTLDPGEEASFSCGVSIHSDYDNPTGGEYKLRLEAVSAYSEHALPWDAITLRSHTPSIRVQKRRWSNDGEIEIKAYNDGEQQLLEPKFLATSDQLVEKLTAVENHDSILPKAAVSFHFRIPAKERASEISRLTVIVRKGGHPAHQWRYEFERAWGLSGTVMIPVVIVVLVLLLAMMFLYPVYKWSKRKEILDASSRVSQPMAESGHGKGASPDELMAVIKQWVQDGQPVEVAIVFTDIVGSTELAERHGDSQWLGMYKAHSNQVRRLQEKYEGHSVKPTGDGWLTVFRHVANAMKFAMDLEADTGHPAIRIRAGVHIGKVLIDGVERDVQGIDVNMAQRIMSKADSGGVWVSDQVKVALDPLADSAGQFRWTKHEGCGLKGLEQEYTLWSVEGLEPT